MGKGSGIEWTESTWNPVTGCTKVSAGCKHCYAEVMARRFQAMGQPNYANAFEVTLQPVQPKKSKRVALPRPDASRMGCFNVPKITFLRYFGMITTCYLPSHRTCEKLQQADQKSSASRWGNNMPKGKSVIGVLVGVLVIAAVIAAVVMRVRVVGPRVDKLRTEVLEPYLALQASGEYRSAYDQFVTADYQKQFPFEDVMTFHQELLAKNGKVTGNEFVRDSAPFFEKEGESIYQVSYRVLYEKGSVLVAFELVPVQGSYRIVSTNVEGRPGSLRLKPY